MLRIKSYILKVQQQYIVLLQSGISFTKSINKKAARAIENISHQGHKNYIGYFFVLDFECH